MTEIWRFIRRSKGSQGLLSLGSEWTTEEYYDSLYTSSEAGLSALEDLKLEFDPESSHLPRYDFVANIVPTCSAVTYEVLRPLIDDYVVSFTTSISGSEYVIFRPICFFDLIDMEASKYR